MEVDYSAIGERIRSTRLSRKITQEILADFTNLSVAHISHIECGKTRVSLPSLISIANALGTTVDTLVYGQADSPYETVDREFLNLLSDCTAKERRLILESAAQFKIALRKTI